MRKLPRPVVGTTLYRRYTPQYLREEIGLVVNVRTQYKDNGDVHSWTAMIAGQDGLQPLGEMDIPGDIHNWHPVDWVVEGFAVRPPTDEEIAERLAESEPAADEVVSETTDGEGVGGPEPTPVPKFSKEDSKETLVNLCKEAELPVYGTKDDLLERLNEAYGV